MFFNASGIDRFLFCNYGAAGNAFSAIQDRGAPDGCAFKGGRSTQGKIEDQRWYEISLVVTRDRAEMFLDGRKVSDASVVPLPSFFATAGYDRKGKAVVLKATNYYKKPLPVTIQLEGEGSVTTTGKRITISSEGQYDENSLDNPKRIVPKEYPLQNCAKEFSVTLPPLSVNVLRVPSTR
jgi:alpha-L-arabinofuranosidase